MHGQPHVNTRLRYSQHRCLGIACLMVLFAVPTVTAAQGFKYKPIGPKTREILKHPVKVEAFQVVPPAGGKAVKEPAIGPGRMRFEIKKTVKVKGVKPAATLSKFVLNPKTRNFSGASGFTAVWAIRVTDKKKRTATVIFDMAGTQFISYAEIEKGTPIEFNWGGFADGKLVKAAQVLRMTVLNTKAN